MPTRNKNFLDFIGTLFYNKKYKNIGTLIKKGEIKMKKKKINVSFTTSGAGSRSTRVILPVKWIDKIGITQEDREVYIYQFGDSILIKKSALKWEQREAVNFTLQDIQKIFEKRGWITYEDIIEVGENTLKAYFDDNKRENKNKTGELYNKINDWLQKNKKSLYDKEENKFYYYNKEIEVGTVEELKNINNES